MTHRSSTASSIDSSTLKQEDYTLIRDAWSETCSSFHCDVGERDVQQSMLAHVLSDLEPKKQIEYLEEWVLQMQPKRHIVQACTVYVSSLEGHAEYVTKVLLHWLFRLPFRCLSNELPDAIQRWSAPHLSPWIRSVLEGPATGSIEHMLIQHIDSVREPYPMLRYILRTRHPELLSFALQIAQATYVLRTPSDETHPRLWQWKVQTLAWKGVCQIIRTQQAQNAFCEYEQIEQALKSMLEKHPLSQGKPSTSIRKIALFCAVTKVVGQLQVTSLRSHLCTLLKSRTSHFSSGNCQPLYLSLIRALERLGMCDISIEALHEHVQYTSDETLQKEAAAVLVRWGCSTLVPVQWLCWFAFKESRKGLKSQSIHALMQHFDISSKEHMRYLMYACQNTLYRIYPEHRYQSYVVIRPEFLSFIFHFVPPELQTALEKKEAQYEEISDLLTSITSIAMSYTSQSPQAKSILRHLERGQIYLDVASTSVHSAALPVHRMLEALSHPAPAVHKSALHALSKGAEHVQEEIYQWVESIPAWKEEELPPGFRSESAAPCAREYFQHGTHRAQIYAGYALGRLVFSFNTTTEERMSGLRWLLKLPPQHASWTALHSFLSRWCQHDAFDADMIYEYVNQHLDSWPDALRYIPRTWWKTHQGKQSWPWPITRMGISLDIFPLRRYSPFFSNTSGEHRFFDRAQAESKRRLTQMKYCTHIFLVSSVTGDKLLEELATYVDWSAVRVLSLEDCLVSEDALLDFLRRASLHSLEFLSVQSHKDKATQIREVLNTTPSFLPQLKQLLYTDKNQRKRDFTRGTP